MKATQSREFKVAGGTYDGTVQICCHYVNFRYWNFDERLLGQDGFTKELDEHAEERAKKCIIDGCSSGELNCYWAESYQVDHEIRGWWEVSKE